MKKIINISKNAKINCKQKNEEEIKIKDEIK